MDTVFSWFLALPSSSQFAKVPILRSLSFFEKVFIVDFLDSSFSAGDERENGERRRDGKGDQEAAGERRGREAATGESAGCRPGRSRLNVRPTRFNGQRSKRQLSTCLTPNSVQSRTQCLAARVGRTVQLVFATKCFKTSHLAGRNPPKKTSALQCSGYVVCLVACLVVFPPFVVLIFLLSLRLFVWSLVCLVVFPFVGHIVRFSLCFYCWVACLLV